MSVEGRRILELHGKFDRNLRQAYRVRSMQDAHDRLRDSKRLLP